MRAKFDALPLLEVSSDNVRAIYEANTAAAGGKSVLARSKEWIASKKLFGKYVNNDTGWTVEFSKGSADNVVSHGAGPQKTALMEIVPDLIETGIHLETNPGKAPGQKTHVFAGRAAIDGEDYAISFAVRENADGKRYYDHSLTKIEALDSLDDISTKSGLRDQNTTPILPKSAIEEPHRVSSQQDNSRAIASSTSLTGKPSLNNILQKHLAVNNKNEPTRETHSTLK